MSIDARFARHAPILMLDSNEPYRPRGFGATLFERAGPSSSSKFEIVPKGAAVLEYAIYYDWDIGHLYDLEHVWVHLDGSGAVVGVEASAHGKRRVMDSGGGLPELRDGRPVVFVEAGKHALWASPDHMNEADRQKLAVLCGPLAGIEGVHEGNPFAGAIAARALDHRLARLKMRADAFVPSHRYAALDPMPALFDWPALAAEIPRRVRAVLETLERTQKRLGAIFLDCGDTLVDERTEVKRAGSEVVLSGDLIPGAADMVRSLERAGHTLILVADGPRETFVNLLGHHGLWDAFAGHVISEDVGALKPDPKMFDAALAAAGLTRADAWRTVMVGNNLSRDIAGANALGITSVFMAWSRLRTHEPQTGIERPNFRIDEPSRLPGLIDRIEALLADRVPGPIGPDPKEA